MQGISFRLAPPLAVCIAEEPMTVATHPNPCTTLIILLARLFRQPALAWGILQTAKITNQPVWNSLATPEVYWASVVYRLTPGELQTLLSVVMNQYKYNESLKELAPQISADWGCPGHDIWNQGLAGAFGDVKGLLWLVPTDDPVIDPDVNRMRDLMPSRTGFARADHSEICRAAYETVLKHKWKYDGPPGLSDYRRQRVRSAKDIAAAKAGTCLDLACYFAALLEHGEANPVLLHLFFRADPTAGAHAIAGCWVDDSLAYPVVLHDPARIRDCAERGDLLLFETTGAVSSTDSVASSKEVRSADGFLTFDQACACGHDLVCGKEWDPNFLLTISAGYAQLAYDAL